MERAPNEGKNAIIINLDSSTATVLIVKSEG